MLGGQEFLEFYTGSTTSGDDNDIPTPPAHCMSPRYQKLTSTPSCVPSTPTWVHDWSSINWVCLITTSRKHIVWVSNKFAPDATVLLVHPEPTLKTLVLQTIQGMHLNHEDQAQDQRSNKFSN